MMAKNQNQKNYYTDLENIESDVVVTNPTLFFV